MIFYVSKAQGLYFTIFSCYEKSSVASQSTIGMCFCLIKLLVISIHQTDSLEYHLLVINFQLLSNSKNLINDLCSSKSFDLWLVE